MSHFRSASRAFLLLLLVTGSVSLPGPVSARALEGKVTMSGAIVDAACSIEVKANDQTITMPPTAISGLVTGEAVLQQPFQVKLVDCGPQRTASNKAGNTVFTLAFEGAGNNQMFLTGGSAKGIAIRIKDSRGAPVLPGAPVHELLPASGNLTLNYALSLTGTGSALRAGDYLITLRLRMNYF